MPYQCNKPCNVSAILYRYCMLPFQLFVQKNCHWRADCNPNRRAVLEWLNRRKWPWLIPGLCLAILVHALNGVNGTSIKHYIQQEINSPFDIKWPQSFARTFFVLCRDSFIASKTARKVNSFIFPANFCICEMSKDLQCWHVTTVQCSIAGKGQGQMKWREGVVSRISSKGNAIWSMISADCRRCPPKRNEEACRARSHNF